MPNLLLQGGPESPRCWGPKETNFLDLEWTTLVSRSISSPHQLSPAPPASRSQGHADLRMPPPTAISTFLTSLSSAKPMSCTECGFGNQTSLTRRDKDKVCKDRKASRARSQGFSDEQSCPSPETSSLAKLQLAK